MKRVLARPEHRLSRKGISANAIKVLYRLQRSGYLAYLVGGAVRDLLLGRDPKDFDVGTNARPQEIKRLFRNSRIIGRRFRLAHIMFRGETVEVSTFRASPEAPEPPDEWEDDGVENSVEESNEPEPADPYGTPEEDALRRDFTVNALFYNIADFSVIDLVGGIADLEAGIIRTVGEAAGRFEEDPVRMMRALEYAVRLDFRLAPETESAIHECHPMITEASAARLTYELMETLTSGRASAILKAWTDFGIFGKAFPDLGACDDEICTILDVLDRRIAMGGTFAPPTLIGAMFIPKFMEIVREIDQRDERFANAELLQRTLDLLETAGGHMHLANYTTHLVRHGLFTMTKLRRPPTRGRQVAKLVRQDYFPVAWDLFSVAAAGGYFQGESLRAWSRAVDRVRSNGAVSDTEVQNTGTEKPRRRRRPRRRRKR